VADAPMVVEVVTPEQELFSAPAQALVLRSSDGDLTILPGHTPLVTDVVPGLVRVDLAEGDPVRLAVHGGYLQVDTVASSAAPDTAAEAGPGSAEASSPGRGTSAGAPGTSARLLAGVAERAEDIDVERAERARVDAEARVNELRGVAGRGEAVRPEGGRTPEEGASEAERVDPELAEAEGALRRAEVRLAVAEGASSPSTG
jgi:F-type H+-transporting ATPase subunit epsilon